MTSEQRAALTACVEILRGLVKEHRAHGCGMPCGCDWCVVLAAAEAVLAEPAQPVATATVADISDGSLVERAVRNAAHGHPAAPRWVHVMRTFALGSTYAQQLCVRFSLDPHEPCGREEDENDDD